MTALAIPGVRRLGIQGAGYHACITPEVSPGGNEFLIPLAVKFSNQRLHHQLLQNLSAG